MKMSVHQPKKNTHRVEESLCVRMELKGWLRKKGGFLGSTYQRRYCVLDLYRRRLSYYKKVGFLGVFLALCLLSLLSAHPVGEVMLWLWLCREWIV